jgi:hypothetical protein
MMFFMQVCLRAVAPATAARGPTGCGFAPGGESCSIAVIVALGISLAPGSVRTSKEGQQKIAGWEDLQQLPLAVRQVAGLRLAENLLDQIVTALAGLLNALHGDKPA